MEEVPIPRNRTPGPRGPTGATAPTDAPAIRIQSVSGTQPCQNSPSPADRVLSCCFTGPSAPPPTAAGDLRTQKLDSSDCSCGPSSATEHRSRHFSCSSHLTTPPSLSPVSPKKAREPQACLPCGQHSTRHRLPVSCCRPGPRKLFFSLHLHPRQTSSPQQLIAFPCHPNDTMAPPPNANLPLQERVLALMKTLQCMCPLPRLPMSPSALPLVSCTDSSPFAVGWFAGYVQLSRLVCSSRCDLSGPMQHRCLAHTSSGVAQPTHTRGQHIGCVESREMCNVHC